MSHRIGAAGPTVPPRGPLSAVPPHSSEPTPCPPWCRADHAADMQRRREMAAEVDCYLGLPPLRSVGPTEVEPAQGFVVETYLLHTVEVGRMPVRTGRAELPAPLCVTVEQVEDVDGTAESTGLLVRIEEPPAWTEDYMPSEARELAALLVRAGQVAQT